MCILRFKIQDQTASKQAETSITKIGRLATRAAGAVVPIGTGMRGATDGATRVPNGKRNHPSHRVVRPGRAIRERSLNVIGPLRQHPGTHRPEKRPYTPIAKSPSYAIRISRAPSFRYSLQQMPHLQTVPEQMLVELAETMTEEFPESSFVWKPMRIDARSAEDTASTDSPLPS